MAITMDGQGLDPDQLPKRGGRKHASCLPSTHEKDEEDGSPWMGPVCVVSKAWWTKKSHLLQLHCFGGHIEWGALVVI